MQICLWAKKIDTIVWESFYCDSKGSWLFSQEVTAKINNLPNNNNAAAQIICKYGHFSTKTCVCLYFGQWKCIYQQKSWLLFSFTRNTQCQYQSKQLWLLFCSCQNCTLGLHQISIFFLFCDTSHYWSNTFVSFRIYIISDPDRNLMGKTSKGSVK